MGSTIFLIFLVVFLIAVAYSLYSRRGSGIASHPSGGGDSAPGAEGAGTMKGDEGERTVGTRGTR